MSRVLIDNSHYKDKVALRKMYTPDGSFVLDCFHGTGAIWEDVAGKINICGILGIEKDKRKAGIGCIVGDNLKVIPGLDLSGFDVIDLDAYGSPYKQIKAIIKNDSWENGVVIFFTYITMAMGVEYELLENIGITRGMLEKNKSLFNKYLLDSMFEYLHNVGVRKVNVINHQDSAMSKHYGCFKLSRS